MADGCRVEIYWKCHISPPNGQIGTKLGWSHPTNTSTAKTFSLVLVVTANRTVNVLVLWGVEIKKIHNFDETWMTVCLCVTKKIKSDRKTANITAKTCYIHGPVEY